MVEPVRQDDIAYNYADLLTLPEDQRWELIDGVLYDMTPAPSRRHQGILAQLHLQFGAFLADSPCRVYFAPFDVRLPKASENAMTSTTVVQPDLAVVCDREKLDDRGCVGSPSLVVEIISPSTAKKDLRAKFRAYERAGVQEYWIIYPSEKMLEVFTLDEHGKYGDPAVYINGEQAPVGVLPGLAIDLASIFAD